MFYKLKIAWRSLRYNKIFTLINIVSLCVGLTVVLIICAMIYNEYSFDKSFPSGNRIYRLNSVDIKINIGMVSGLTCNPFAPAVKEEVPEVEFVTRTYVVSSLVKLSDVFFKIDKFCWADEDFFRIFDTPFVYGSPETALSKPGSVALSESKARILFGDRDPIGEMILVDGKNDMTVQAVYKDFPTNSSFADYDVIGQFASSHHPINPRNEGYYNWGNLGYETFCLLAEDIDAAYAEKMMQYVLEKNTTDGFFRVQLQPFEKIHLYSAGIETYTYSPGDVNRIKMLSLLAGIILLVACINYMNLSTARAQKRSKYIGVSKTFGIRRSLIIRRLYTETALITFIAFIAAFVFSILLLPVFNQLMGQQISFGIFLHPVFLLGLLTVYLITTFFAASYPAFYLAGFAPLSAIRKGCTKDGSHATVRKALSVIQFSVAIVLVAWVFIIALQMKYITGKDLGYDVTGVFGILLSGVSTESDFTALKADYAAQSSVSAVAFTSAFPLGRGPANAFCKNQEVMKEWWENGKPPNPDEITDLCTSFTSPEIVDMLRLKLITGSISQENGADNNNVAYAVINRKAVAFLEKTPEEVIGTNIYAAGMSNNTRVIGVVEDFNYLDLHEPIGPYCFYFSERRSKECLLLRANENNMSQQLALYETIFKKHFPNDFFEVTFPSLLQQKAYEPDRQTNRMAVCFSVLAIMVACLGVLGLTAFMVEQRVKEIGVRKVLGASVGSIIRLFVSGYIWLLIISLGIAIPVAWLVGERYLQDFAYHISLSWYPFVLAALLIIIVTLLTVCTQALKVAVANPVKSIKTE